MKQITYKASRNFPNYVTKHSFTTYLKTAALSKCFIGSAQRFYLHRKQREYEDKGLLAKDCSQFLEASSEAGEEGVYSN
jgi:hypothetical protein